MRRKVTLFLVALLLIPCFLYAQGIMQTVERQYKWYAEEKLTVSNTVKQLSSEEYRYWYGPTRIPVTAGSGTWVLNEVVTDGTTAAMGTLYSADSLTSPTYLDIIILYNGLDSADIDPNDTLTGAGAATATVSATYTRGDTIPGMTQTVLPQIAEIYMLDNSIIWTYNGATPVYSATDASCFGRKSYEGDTFYIFGVEAIQKFKALRSSGTDSIIAVRYGF